jgi:hypothetical protein
LTAIAALGSTGIAVRTASNTWAQRQITSTDASVAITNPAGVAGNIDLSASPTIVGILTTTGASTVGTWAIPAGVKRFTVTSNKSSLSGSGDMLVQLRVAAAFVTSGYSSRSLSGTSGNISSTSGLVVSLGNTARYFDGAMQFWLHDPATNLWLCSHVGSEDDAGGNMVFGSGSIALAGAIDGVRISASAGTFDVSSFNVSY